MTSQLPMTVLKINHHNAQHVAARYPYAAYGSNLMMRQISERCPKVELIASGKLLDYRLDFAYVATITADEGAVVPIGIYKLAATDIERLDKKEGMGRVYDRFLVTVIADDGRAIRCFTYIKKTCVLEPPSVVYYSRLQEGYRDWHFEDRRLRHARKRAVTEWDANAPAREAARAATAKLVAKYPKYEHFPSASEYWAQGDMLEPIEPWREKSHRRRAAPVSNVVPIQSATPTGYPKYLTMVAREAEWGTRGGEMYFRAKNSRVWYRDVSMPEQISHGMVTGELATNLPGSQAYQPLDNKRHDKKGGK